jgi:hypothetical protein
MGITAGYDGHGRQESWTPEEGRKSPATIEEGRKDFEHYFPVFFPLPPSSYPTTNKDSDIFAMEENKTLHIPSIRPFRNKNH